MTAWHAFSPGPAHLLRRLLRHLTRRIKVDQLGPKKLKNLRKCLKLLRKTPGVFEILCVFVCFLMGFFGVRDFWTNPPFEVFSWFPSGWSVILGETIGTLFGEFFGGLTWQKLAETSGNPWKSHENSVWKSLIRRGKRLYQSRSRSCGRRWLLPKQHLKRAEAGDDPIWAWW